VPRPFAERERRAEHTRERVSGVGDGGDTLSERARALGAGGRTIEEASELVPAANTETVSVRRREGRKGGDLFHSPIAVLLEAYH
jgi:hypothetical protein